MELDRNGLEVLDREACLALLGSVPVARIGLSMQALPVILPVNFVMDGDDIIIRTAAGAKTEAALRGSVVAFEADDHDPFAHTGWSVLVRGRSRFIHDPVEIERLRGLWVQAWGTPRTDRWIAIAMEVVTGRRILHTARSHDVAVGDDPAAASEAPPAPSTDAPIEGSSTVVAWEAWGAVRADHHSTAADPRTAAARPHLLWPSSDHTGPVGTEEDR